MLQILGMIEPKEPVQSVSMATTTSASQSNFERFCGFIKTYEGANPLNNNPYDFRYYFGGYLPKYGTVKESSGGFAMFETLAIGEEYGETCITEMVQNHPEWSFNDFFNRYAPDSDGNDSELYAFRAAEVFAVEPSANLKSTLNI